MGNYYEGSLEFAFKPECSTIIDNIINICKFIITNDNNDKLDFNQRTKNLEDYVKSTKNDFTIGIDLYRDRYNDIRRFRCNFGTNIDDMFYEGYDLFDLFKDIYYNDEDLYESYPDLPRKLDNINYESLSKVFCTKWSKEYNTEINLLFILEFNVSDKGFNGDEELTKLIELWSPYLDEDYYEEGYIGTIEDEDRTFRKDYYIGNKVHETHWEFCGEWCDYYNTNVRCKDIKCRYAYDLGKNSKDD